MSKKPAPVIANLLSSAVGMGKAKENTVKVLCELIAVQMEEIHGGDWWAQIDHEVGFILVRQR